MLVKPKLKKVFSLILVSNDCKSSYPNILNQQKSIKHPTVMLQASCLMPTTYWLLPPAASILRGGLGPKYW